MYHIEGYGHLFKIDHNSSIWNNRRKESPLVILPSRIYQQGKFLFFGLVLLFTSGGVIEESKSLWGEGGNGRGGPALCNSVSSSMTESFVIELP